MPTISERELSEEQDVWPCQLCDENDGDIWLCGEGMICASCFAEASGTDETIVLNDKVTDQDRSRAKAKLLKERDEEDEVRLP